MRYGETAVVQFKASKRQGKFTFFCRFIVTFLSLRLCLAHFDAFWVRLTTSIFCCGSLSGPSQIWVSFQAPDNEQFWSVSSQFTRIFCLEARPMSESFKIFVNFKSIFKCLKFWLSACRGLDRVSEIQGFGIEDKWQYPQNLLKRMYEVCFTNSTFSNPFLYPRCSISCYIQTWMLFPALVTKTVCFFFFC